MLAHHGTILATAAEMRLGAHQLAASIEAGEFDALSAEQRCDLRLLPMKLREWADAIDPDQAPAVTVEDEKVLRFPKRPIPVLLTEEAWR